MPAPDAFHFDITPSEHHELLQNTEAPLILPGSNGYTVAADNATNTPQYHRHARLEVGDSTTFLLDFATLAGGPVFPGITTLENVVTFNWTFYDRLGPDKVVYAQADFWFAGALTLGVHVLGLDQVVDGVLLKGTENMAGPVKRGKHVLDATYLSVGGSGAVHYTVLQGNWYARGGHAL